MTAELLRLLDRPAWMRRAACRGCDPDLFHPEHGDKSNPAKAVCATCPVQAECLDHAIRNGEVHGVWGGTNARERRRLRAEWARLNGVNVRAVSRQRPIRHGELSGARRCYKRPEGACPACRDVYSRYMEFAPGRRRRKQAT